MNVRSVVTAGLGIVALGAAAVVGHHTASAQPTPTWGELETVNKAASIGKGPITRIEWTKGYPGARGVEDGKYFIVLWTPGKKACAIMGDHAETARLYELLVDKKIRYIRCAVGTDSYVRARIDQPEEVFVSVF